jgi:hypothetical protein
MMSHLEFETLLAQISHYLNNKPLILLPQVGESLTPNDLLHGMLKRKDAFVAPTDTNLFKRQSMLANNLERWWNTFIQAWENKLVELSKWRIPHPNPTKGSLVLILDRKIGNSYQLGEIVNVVENEDGLVNVCTIQYTVNGKKKRFDRPVRGLSVVMTADERKLGGVNLVQMAQDMEDGIPPRADYAVNPNENDNQPPTLVDDRPNTPGDTNYSGDESAENPNVPGDSSNSDDSDDGNVGNNHTTSTPTTYVVPKGKVLVTTDTSPPDVVETPDATSKRRAGRPARRE